MAMAAKIAMIAITTISSIKVKPRWFRMLAPNAHAVALLAGKYLQKMRQPFEQYAFSEGRYPLRDAGHERSQIRRQKRAPREEGLRMKRGNVCRSYQRQVSGLYLSATLALLHFQVKLPPFWAPWNRTVLLCKGDDTDWPLNATVMSHVWPAPALPGPIVAVATYWPT